MAYITKLLITLIVPLLFSYVLYPVAQKLRLGKDGLLIMATSLSLLTLMIRELYGRTFTYYDIFIYVTGVFISIIAIRGWFEMKTRWLKQSALTEVFNRDFGLPKDMRLRHLLQFAILIEKEGADFYRKLSQETQDTSSRQVYDKLSRDEVEHEVTFKRIVNRWLSIDDKNNTVPDIYTAAKERGVFSFPPSFETGEKEVIKYAIDQEKRLLNFYLAFEKAFPEAWKRAQVAQIAMFEKSHIEELNALLETRK